MLEPLRNSPLLYISRTKWKSTYQRHYSHYVDEHEIPRQEFIKVRSTPPLANIGLGMPTQVACYSRESSTSFSYNSNASLRRLLTPEDKDILLPTTLYGGYNDFLRQGPAVTHEINRPELVSRIVDACLVGRKDAHKALLQADVVATKEALNAIFGGRGSLAASLVNNTLYLQSYPKAKSYGITTEGYLARYGFQRLCTRLYWPPEKAQESSPLGLNYWTSIVSRTLGGLNLLISGEIPCVDTPYTGQPDCYTDLRCRKVEVERVDPSDLKTWYFSSHIMGIPAMIFGQRNEKGYLHDTKVIRTDELIDIVNTSRLHKFNQYKSKYLNSRSLMDNETAPAPPAPWEPSDIIQRSYQTLQTLRDELQKAIDEREIQLSRYLSTSFALSDRDRRSRIHRRDDVVWKIGLGTTRATYENEEGQANGGKELSFSFREFTQTEYALLAKADPVHIPRLQEESSESPASSPELDSEDKGRSVGLLRADLLERMQLLLSPSP